MMMLCIPVSYRGSMAEIVVRPVTDEEYPAFAKAVFQGFSDDLQDGDFVDGFKTVLPIDQTLAAFDGAEIVGTFGSYSLEITVPGGSVPMAGTTVVTVFPTHRRMGLMGQMMRRHLDTVCDDGAAIAGLWASESNLYGRYGYGIATYSREMNMRASEIVFREGVDIDRVRRIPVEDSLPVIRSVFDAALSSRPGVLARTDAWWKHQVLHDAVWRREGRTSLRIVVHDGDDGPDGYVIYRQKGGHDGEHADGTVHFNSIVALTDRAHSSLWSYLTNIDGCPNVRSWNAPVDDPLAMKLVEPRRLKGGTRKDALWILILDVVAALEARSYEQDGTIRFTVENAFRADVGGSYELSVKDGVSSCVRIDGETDIDLDLDVLGALYLGGGDAHAYAAAARIRGDVEATSRLHGLFRTAKQPWCNQVF